MNAQTLDVKDAQGQLTELVKRVMSGVRIILRQDNKPVAELVPATGRASGLHADAIHATGDFDEPLADQFWTDGK